MEIIFGMVIVFILLFIQYYHGVYRGRKEERNKNVNLKFKIDSIIKLVDLIDEFDDLKLFNEDYCLSFKIDDKFIKEGKSLSKRISEHGFHISRFYDDVDWYYDECNKFEKNWFAEIEEIMKAKSEMKKYGL